MFHAFISCAVDFRELLNVSSGDLSVAHGLNLTDLYSVATQNQSVFLQEYVFALYFIDYTVYTDCTFCCSF